MKKALLLVSFALLATSLASAQAAGVTSADAAVYSVQPALIVGPGSGGEGMKAALTSKAGVGTSQGKTSLGVTPAFAVNGLLVSPTMARTDGAFASTMTTQQDVKVAAGITVPHIMPELIVATAPSTGPSADMRSYGT